MDYIKKKDLVNKITFIRDEEGKLRGCILVSDLIKMPVTTITTKKGNKQ